MHKGLKSTLLTVAVALLGFKAMATAPTISSMPDIIIGDAETATPANEYVFPDAVDADTKVSDTDSTDGQIIWSYTNPGGNYRINNATPNTGDLVNPAAGSRINVVDTDPKQVDNNPRTFTFRNIVHSPIGGSYTQATTSEGQVVTVVASDGSTASQASFMVYTDDDGLDMTSGSAQGQNVLSLDFSTTTNGWTPFSAFVGNGGVITQTQTANGLCIGSTAGGNVIGGWTSQTTAPYSTLSIAGNSVYQARINLSTTANAGTCPMWNLYIENSLNWYGNNFWLFDAGGSINNSGAGADAPFPLSGRQVYEEWFAPASNEQPNFQTALTNVANASNVNARIQLSLFDPAVPEAFGGAALDQGTICFRSLEINKFDRSTESVLATDYNQTNLVPAVNRAAGTEDTTVGGITAQSFDALSTIAFSGGDIAITPASANAWQNAGAVPFVQVRPGDTTITGTTPAGNADNRDNFPAIWKSDTLYKVSWTIKAHDAAGENTPLDFIFVGALVLTNELITNNYVTTKLGHSAMPTQTPGNYVCYWHGNNRTLEPGDWQRVGPTLQVGCNDAFLDNQNLGGIDVQALKFEEVSY